MIRISIATVHPDDNIEPDSLEWTQPAPSRARLPRSVSWDLPLTLDGDDSKRRASVLPQIGSQKNPPPAHKCQLKAIHRTTAQSRPRWIASGRGKSKWTGQISVQQLLPSKTNVESGRAESARGTNSSAVLPESLAIRIATRKLFKI